MLDGRRCLADADKRTMILSLYRSGKLFPLPSGILLPGQRPAALDGVGMMRTRRA
mgnify:CR=1 FL=1